MFGGSPRGEDVVDRGGEGMGKNFGVGVGSGEGACFVGGTCGAFRVIEVRFGEEPKNGGEGNEGEEARRR